MTIDEELDLLDNSLRRLKIEYDIYFGGGAKRPPNDTLWRVQSLIKKFGDSQKLTFAQRYKFNALTQRYAIFSDLWRQKLKIKEEGYRRPQDAVLGITGLRTDAERAAQQALGAMDKSESDFSRIACSDVDQQLDHVRAFYDRMMSEKQKVGEQSAAPFESFASFLRKKTEQIRRDFKCEAVEYSLDIQGNQVKLKAKPKPA
ncbi:MAG TPA: MXAN_5187 C-terminal domain-containing protein [Candidatus Koribacter sp.]